MFSLLFPSAFTCLQLFLASVILPKGILVISSKAGCWNEFHNGFSSYHNTSMTWKIQKIWTYLGLFFLISGFVYLQLRITLLGLLASLHTTLQANLFPNYVTLHSIPIALFHYFSCIYLTDILKVPQILLECAIKCIFVSKIHA